VGYFGGRYFDRVRASVWRFDSKDGCCITLYPHLPTWGAVWLFYCTSAVLRSALLLLRARDCVAIPRAVGRGISGYFCGEFRFFFGWMFGVCTCPQATPNFPTACDPLWCSAHQGSCLVEKSGMSVDSSKHLHIGAHRAAGRPALLACSPHHPQKNTLNTIYGVLVGRSDLPAHHI